MKRTPLILAAVFALALIGVAFFWPARSHVQLVDTDSAPPSVSSATSPATAAAPAPGSAPAPAPGASPPPRFAGDRFEAPPEVSKRFSGYLGAEAKMMDSNRLDSAAAEERAKAEGAAMGAAEIRYARDLALSPKAPGNLRVAAAYSLTKASWPLSRDALAGVIHVGGNSGRAEPHSVEEVTNTQAKAFALMAVDRLAELAVSDPGARADLERHAREVRDPTIQRYIQDKLKNLPPLR